MISRSKYLIFIILGVLTFILTKLFAYRPDLCELWYQQVIFSKIRVFSDILLTWSPIPWIYILIASLLLLLRRWVRRTRNTVFLLFPFIYRMIAMAGLIYFLFQFLWGFNYQQRDLKERLDLANPEIDQSIYLGRLEALVCAMEETRIDMDVPIDKALETMPVKLWVENTIRIDMKRFLKENMLFSTGEVRVRLLNPAGSLLSFSTAGIYIPFVFEGHIDAGLHPLQIPYTLAHEMAHGYAVTDEGEANFIAFMVCVNSTNPFIRYSGLFSYYRYLASNIYRNDPEIYHSMREQFPAFVELDLNAVRKKMNEYPDLLPALRNWMYDHYLNAQGVHAGIKSYSSIVQMVTAWEIRRDYLF